MTDFDVKQEGVTGPGRRPVTHDTTVRELWENLKHDLKHVDEAPLPGWRHEYKPMADWLGARLGVGFLSIVGTVIAALVLGTPHMLTTYQCTGPCRSSYAREDACWYVGITGGLHAPPVDGKCPRFRLL